MSRANSFPQLAPGGQLISYLSSLLSTDCAVFIAVSLFSLEGLMAVDDFRSFFFATLDPASSFSSFSSPCLASFLFRSKARFDFYIHHYSTKHTIDSITNNHRNTWYFQSLPFLESFESVRTVAESNVCGVSETQERLRSVFTFYFFFRILMSFAFGKMISSLFWVVSFGRSETTSWLKSNPAKYRDLEVQRIRG